MLTLRDHKDAIKICDLVTGKHKRQDVNYIGEHDPEHRSKVDSIRALLVGHTDQSKTRLRVNDEAIQSAIQLLESGTEPGEEDSAHATKSYWFLKDLAEQLVTSQMDIRDQKNQRFEINFPPIDQFMPPIAVLGPTNCGKGHFITRMVRRMWESTRSPLKRRKVYYVSSEATIDKTLDYLRIKKFEDWFWPIDVSQEAGEQSGLTPEDFWAQKVDAVISGVRDSVLVLDDTQDSYAPKMALKTQNRTARIARHRNNSLISVFHSIKNGIYTQQLLQSAGYVVLFGKAQRGRCRDWFYEALGMPRREAAALVRKMNHCGRASVIRLRAPVALICEKYIQLL